MTVMPNPFDAMFNRRRESAGILKDLIEMLLGGQETNLEMADMPDDLKEVLEAINEDYDKSCVIHFSRTPVAEGEHTGQMQQVVHIEGTGRPLLNCLALIMSELLKKGIPVDALVRCVAIAQVTAILSEDNDKEPVEP
jgi:hypothetical protein